MKDALHSLLPFLLPPPLPDSCGPPTLQATPQPLKAGVKQSARRRCVGAALVPKESRRGERDRGESCPNKRWSVMDSVQDGTAQKAPSPAGWVGKAARRPHKPPGEAPLCPLQAVHAQLGGTSPPTAPTPLS